MSAWNWNWCLLINVSNDTDDHKKKTCSNATKAANSDTEAAAQPSAAPPVPATPIWIPNWREQGAHHQPELPTNNPIDIDDPFVVPGTGLPQVDQHVAFASPSQWDSPWLHSPSDAPQEAAALETPLNHQTKDFRWVFETPGSTFRINQQTLSTPIHHNHGQKDKTPRAGPHSTHRSAKKKKMNHKKTDDVYPFSHRAQTLVDTVCSASKLIHSYNIETFAYIT